MQCDHHRCKPSLRFRRVQRGIESHRIASSRRALRPHQLLDAALNGRDRGCGSSFAKSAHTKTSKRSCGAIHELDFELMRPAQAYPIDSKTDPCRTKVSSSPQSSPSIFPGYLRPLRLISCPNELFEARLVAPWRFYYLPIRFDAMWLPCA